MNITKLQIKNFLTVGEANLDLDNRGLLLIQGCNLDDPSTESNGSGKSSIVDSIAWCVYGVTARGVSGDAVVNKTAKKDCKVIVEIEDGATTYRIARYRKDATNKNQVIVAETSTGGGVSRDLSKGTDRETQEVINKVMGCSLEVFMAAVYCGQERMIDLPGATDKMLKVLIEEAAGVEVLTEAYTVARNRYNGAKSTLDSVTANHTSALAAQTRLEADLAGHEAQSKDFEDGRRERTKAKLAETLPITAEIARLEAELKTTDESSISKELNECKVRLDAFKGEQAHFDSLNRTVSDLDRDASRVRTEATMMKRDLDANKAKLANIEAQVGKSCGECGKTYCEHDLDGAKEVRLEEIKKQETALTLRVMVLKTHLASLEEAQDAAAKYKAGMTDITLVAQRQRELSNLLNAIESTKSKIARLKREVEVIKANANVKLTETNPWTKAIESKQAEIDMGVGLIESLSKQIAESTVEVEMLADAVKVFGPAGVRAHILDTVTPYLNDRTQDYLGALTDGNIHAVWSTLSTTAKGDIKEKFNIEVSNDKGAESFAGLSGGEKRKVRLATSMALQDMVASRATKPLGIFLADEIDDALDEAGLERLMGVLERKARERGTVLVISHNALGEWIDSVITVTKSGGLATVSGATTHGY